LRGTGTLGLRGLEPCSPIPSTNCQLSAVSHQLQVIRPLLDINREETTTYCEKYQLNPRIDSSNLSLSFLRNRLRLQLLPLLRQYNPGVDQALLRLADIAREDSAFIEQQAARLWDEVAREEDNAIRLDRKQAAKLPVALQRQLLRAAVAALVGDTRDIEASHIEAARGLLSKPVGKRLSLPHGLVCHGDYDELVIARDPAAVAGQSQLSPCPFPPVSGEFLLEVPGETVLPGWNVRASIVPDTSPLSLRGAPPPCHCEESQWNRDEESHSAQGQPHPDGVGALAAGFDLQKTGSELFVRRRRPGDRFQPLGMDTSKKLQDFMVDARIPRSWRDRIPIVCSPQQIVWVVGWRIDDRVKVTEASKEILRLEFSKRR
jgi:tRNA(Ile)-lysidine synthase